MQINKIQNNNSNFQGVIRIQNLKRMGAVTEIATSPEYDKGLADAALKLLFEGDWANQGTKKTIGKNLAAYVNIIKQTLGVKFPPNNKEVKQAVLKRNGLTYSIKADNEYKITHIPNNYTIWA